MTKEKGTPHRKKDCLLLVVPWSADHPAGVSVVVRKLAQQNRAEQMETVVLVSDWDHVQPADGPDGATWFRFAVIDNQAPSAALKSALRLPAQLLRTHHLLRALRATAVNFHYVSLQALGVALLKRLGLFRGRLVLSFHGTDVRRPESRLDRYLWRFMLEAADAVTACSKSLAQRVAQTYGVAQERVIAIYNGVDAELFLPSPLGQNARPSNVFGRYIVNVGSYIPRKGQRTLVAAFSQIAPDFPDVGLKIVGMNGPERNHLQDCAGMEAYRERLVCLVDKPQEEVASIVGNASICVQSSLDEPFGMSVIEAGACGVPVVATAVGGHMELIKDGETGLLFPTGDVEACARAIRRILGNPAAADAMATKFRREILADYTWHACAARYFALATEPRE